MAVSKPAPDPGDLITGVMLQITQHAERLALLDQREATHFRETASRLADLARTLAETSNRAEASHEAAARQSALLDTLDGLDQQVGALAARLTLITAAEANDASGEKYQPVPAPRWWKLDETERKEALGRLRAWVEQIYRPGYGHLAAALGPCWDQHPLCLYGLDWLMELWSVLYLTPERQPSALASQAEWQTRLLPALAEQLYLETTRCEHAQQTANRRPAQVGTARNGERPGHPGSRTTP
jgi:hypothetical protein